VDQAYGSYGPAVSGSTVDRPVLCSSELQSVIIPFLELRLEKNIVLLNVLCMFRSFYNLCAMSNLCFVIIYSQVL
jgi:hypothetical protein